MTSPSWLAIGGVVWPASFVVTWSVLSAARPWYSPVDDPISSLAAVDAATRHFSLGAALAVAIALLTSALSSEGAGVAQRIGLTLGDAWIAATAVAILRAGRHRTAER